MHLTLFDALAIAAGIWGLIFLYVWTVYNTMVKKRNQVRTDFSDVNVQLKRKADLVDQLVGLVREYAKHEKDTFENVAKARSAVSTSTSVKEAAQADNFLTQTMRSLFAVVEDYPKLQASQNYQGVSQDLKDIENLIAEYREEYNKTVQSYNNFIQTFPNLLAASVFRFAEEDLFQV